VGRVGETLVAVAAESTGGDDRPLSGLDEVEGLAVEAGDGRSRRHRDDQVGAAGAVPVRAAAVPAAPGPVMGGYAHRCEIAPRRVGGEHDIAAAAAVAAVGTAARHVRLTAEADRAVAAAAALDVDAGLVVEHGESKAGSTLAARFSEQLRGAGRCPLPAYSVTDTTRPLRPAVNPTVPARVAKIV
jgi:hypothetical protein